MPLKAKKEFLKLNNPQNEKEHLNQRKNTSHLHGNVFTNISINSYFYTELIKEARVIIDEVKEIQSKASSKISSKISSPKKRINKSQTPERRSLPDNLNLYTKSLVNFHKGIK